LSAPVSRALNDLKTAVGGSHIMAQYYTLDEAAQKLGLTTETFRRKLATEWKNSPRRYPDGATLRFQVREIDELSRSLGHGSSAEVQAADAPMSDSSEDFVPLASSEDVVTLGGTKSGRLPKSAPDSDIKLEAASGKNKPPSSKVKKQAADQPTEEFELDSGRVKGPKTPQKGQKFEVSSDPDIKIKPPKEPVDSGSEFELSLAPDSSDEFDLKLSDDDSDEVQIGTMPRSVKAGDSGINLQAPADSGISLEDKSSSSEFELQLQADEGKPSSKPKKPSTDKIPPSVQAKTDESDSEFELTLDDSGEKPATESTTTFDSGEQKDIFETDFELPALEDESGSEAVGLESDTDVESSDFDLAIDESDAGAEEASESEVVAIDEEEAEAPTRRRRAEAEDELDELEAAEDVDLEAEEEVRPSRAPVAAAPATWGTPWVLMLLLWAPIMLLTGMMGFELLHSMWGYQQPYKPTGGLIRFIAESVGDKLPTD
jgi:hypothetical protein